jgi:AraC-like DNA-binding protein
MSQYIEHIIYASDIQPGQYMMELPDTKLNLVIELNSKTRHTMFTEKSFQSHYEMRHGWLAGAYGKSVFYGNNHIDSEILSIRFKLGGFYALTKIPMSEITHPGLEIELLLGNSFYELYERLINEPDIDLKFKHIELYFREYIRNNDFGTSLASFMAKNIDKPVDWLVSKSGYSQKHFIHLLKAQTGLSPKFLQRLHRFQKIVDRLQNIAYEKNINWASLAYEYNYFDQAHFIKDFINFIGMSPVEYHNLNASTEQNKVLKDVKLL